MSRGNGQTDGGASAYDAGGRRKHHVEQAVVPWPDGCKGCDYTGRREVAEHNSNVSPARCTVHPAACGCARGKARTDRQAVPAFFTIRDAIQARGNVAVLDPTPRQRQPGGLAPLEIPKCGDYVPRNAGRGRHLMTPIVPRDVAHAWLHLPGTATRPSPQEFLRQWNAAGGPPGAVVEAAPIIEAPPLPVSDEPPDFGPAPDDGPPFPDDGPPSFDDEPPFPIDDDAQPW